MAPALRGLGPAHVVGGAVRDLLRGAGAQLQPDLDLALEADVAPAAAALAELLGGEAVLHARFNTATVTAPGLVVDLARTRRESYPRPGALPDVEPAPLAEDLARRDFTVNAMAFGPVEAGDPVLHDPLGGRRDLAARRLRVIHPGSFRDDPTRLLRAARYAARLGFRLEPATEELARVAVAEGALGTVSATRIAQELELILREPPALSALGLLSELGVTAALGLDPGPLEPALAAAGELGADRVATGLAAMACRLEVADPAAHLGVGGALGARVRLAATTGPRIAGALARPRGPAELAELLAGVPPEALAVALALGAPRDAILRWMSELRHVSLEVSGRELIEAGLPQSPALGRALRETLRLKLEGKVSGRDEELAAALALARGETP